MKGYERRLLWIALLVTLALALACITQIGEKDDNDEDDTTDDDMWPGEPPPAPIDCWRDQGNLSIILLYWQYDPADFDLVDNFVVRRRQAVSNEWKTIAEPEPNTGTAYQQYEDMTAECNVTYYYVIFAVNSAGYSDPCQLSAIKNCE